MSVEEKKNYKFVISDHNLQNKKKESELLYSIEKVVLESVFVCYSEGGAETEREGSKERISGSLRIRGRGGGR